MTVGNRCGWEGVHERISPNDLFKLSVREKCCIIESVQKHEKPRKILPMSEAHALGLYGDRATRSWLHRGEQLKSVGEATRPSLQHCFA